MIFLLAMCIGIKLADFNTYGTSALALVLLVLISALIFQKSQKKWLVVGLGLLLAYGLTVSTKANLEKHTAEMTHLSTEKGQVQVSGVFYQKNLLDKKQCWLQLDSGGKCKLQFSAYKTYPEIPSGTHVAVSGKFSKASPERNPNGFDERQWLFSKKAFGTISLQTLEADNGKGDVFEKYRQKLLKPLVENLMYKTALKQGPLAVGMLFGEDGWIEEEVMTSFSTAGVNHILSVSGAHFAVLIFWIYFILGQRNFSFWLKKALVWFILGGFIWLIGMDVAALRAYVMFMILDLMRIHYKQTDGLNALCLTLIIMLLLNPYSIGDLGLQLAVSAMYAIVVLAPFVGAVWSTPLKIRLKLEPHEPPLKKWLFKRAANTIEAVNISLCVTVMLYPILRNQFNSFSFLSILYNIPISIASAISLPASIICCGLSMFPFLAKSIGVLNGLCLKFMTLIVETSAYLPHQSHLPNLSPLQTFLCYSLLLMPLYFKQVAAGICALEERSKTPLIQRRLVLLSTGLFLSIVLFLPTYSVQDKVQVFCFDVGQGDGTLLITPKGKTILIDSGLESGKLKVMDTLLKLGISSVDLMILSHPHDDHIGGAPEILENLTVKEIALFNGTYTVEESVALNELLQLAKARQTKITYWEKGAGLDLDTAVTLKVLHPPAGYDSENTNDESLVCEIIYQKTSFLFTGDISTTVECDIIEQVEGESIFLKVPHHGSGSSSGDELLSLPLNSAVIQVGQNNRYGHPNPKALSRLNSKNIPLMRTDTKGCIVLYSDGETLTYKSQIKEE